MKSFELAREHIGIFDSGLGGLTVMRKIIEECPQESLIYFGDTARVPYGGKSPETILRYTVENSLFLMEQNIKVLVIACNTAASYSIERLRNIFPIPILDVISPGADRATEVTRSGKIGLLATKATISSGSYQREILNRLPGAKVFPVACPLFVPLVEENFLNHEATRLIVKEYLKPIKEAHVDTVLLGCTHYPVLASLIQEELGPEVTIVDSASTCANQLKKLLYKYDIEAVGPGARKFFVSDDPEKFMLLGESFLGEAIMECDSIRHEFQSA